MAGRKMVSKESPNTPYRFDEGHDVEVKTHGGKWLPGTITRIEGNQISVLIPTAEGPNYQKVHERKVREPQA